MPSVVSKIVFGDYPVDTGRKLNVHKTFRRRPGRLLYVFCTFNLRPVSTGLDKQKQKNKTDNKRKNKKIKRYSYYCTDQHINFIKPLVLIDTTIISLCL